jgi:hypothetical protein
MMEYPVTTQDLENLRTMLLDVIDKAEEIARNDGGYVQDVMEAYLIPHLQTWAEDPRQIGSIPSLINTLDGEEEDGSLN